MNTDHGIVVFQVGMWAVFIVFVGGGLVTIAAGWIAKYKRNKRRYRRLYETGYRYSTRDFK
jgi:hypothetical protein